LFFFVDYSYNRSCYQYPLKFIVFSCVQASVPAFFASPISSNFLRSPCSPWAFLNVYSSHDRSSHSFFMIFFLHFYLSTMSLHFLFIFTVLSAHAAIHSLLLTPVCSLRANTRQCAGLTGACRSHFYLPEGWFVLLKYSRVSFLTVKSQILKDHVIFIPFV